MPKRDILVSITPPPPLPKPEVKPDGKAEDSKPDDPKSGEPSAPAAAVTDTKPSDAATTVASNGDAKPDPKPAENKPAEPEPKPTTVAVSAGVAYPDLTTRFVIGYRSNYVGTNKLNVSINERGLLSSAGAETVSGVVELATAIGQTRGMRVASLVDAEKPPECKPGQTYSISVDPSIITAHAPSTPSSIGTLCEFTILGQKLWPETARAADAKSAPGVNALGANAERSTDVHNGPARQAGIFYRQALPYKIVVAEKGNLANSREFIVFSPTEAPVSFLPIERTVFASNNAKVTFADGMPTGYEQSADGEILAFLKLPATIYKAYFAAIGETFASIKGNAENEEKYLEALNALTVAQLSRKACEEAVRAEKADEEIRAACTATE